MSELHIDVRGIPGAQGSKKHVGHGVMVESSKKVKPWRDDVKAAAEAALMASDEWDAPCRRAVHLVVTFTFTRPQSHYRTGRFAHVLRDSAPTYVTSHSAGDLDKLVRSTGDALTQAGVIHDDSLIVTTRSSKIYTQHAGARITLATVTPDPVVS